MEITKEEAKNLVWGDSGEDFKVLADEITGTSRWSTLKRVVFTKDGTPGVWAADYSTGATEYQEHEPFEYQDFVKCYEVELVPIPTYRRKDQTRGLIQCAACPTPTKT